MSDARGEAPDKVHEPAAILRPLLRVRQIREFTPEPPSQAAIEAIVDVARWTGSSTNSQPWRFVVVRDAVTIARIAEIGLPSTRSLRTATAAIAIVLPDGATSISLAYDDGRVAERILIAASQLGLGAGIAWVRSELRQEIGGMLGLQSDRFIRTIMALGHPSEAGLRPKSAPGQGRLPRAETVFSERWPSE
jgi:nitroreductase